MTVPDDHLASLHSAAAQVRRPISGWRSQNGRIAFWGIAAACVPVLCLAWFWYGLAYLEEMTDSDPGPGSTGAVLGLGMFLGGIPVIVVHALLLLVLVLIGAMSHARRGIGVLLAVFAVLLGSGVGIAGNQLLWSGCLFAMSATQLCPAYVP